MGRRRRKPREWIEIAKERIHILLDLAEKSFATHTERSRRYIWLARRIAMRYNVRMSKDEKRRFCRKCFTLLKPGVTSRVRLSPSKRSVIVTCLTCGSVRRYPYIKEKSHNKK